MRTNRINKRWSKYALPLLAGGILALTSEAKPKDDPISQAQAVSLLQEGLVYEWKHDDGGGLQLDLERIREAKKAGFHHVRIRNHWNDQTAELPLNKPFNKQMVDDLETLIDATLAEGLGAVICFRGQGVMDEGKAGKPDRTYTKRYVRFWTMLAERFQHKSHRLFFNLFIEPGSLAGINGEVYQKLTQAIRKTNPTRMIVYYKTPAPQLDKAAGAGRDDSIAGPEYWAKSEGVRPKEAGRYYLWDYHILKHDIIANQWKVKQTWQYQQAVKEAMWCGAWSAQVDGNVAWKKTLSAAAVSKALKEYGMSSSILCVGSNTFHKKGGWSNPEMVDHLTKGVSIWWNMLDNPGFNQETNHWTTSGAKVSTTGGIENSPYLAMHSLKPISQNITRALNNNGPGVYDVLGSFYSSTTFATQFSIKITDQNGTNEFKASALKMPVKKWSDVREEIEVTWSGELKKAELVITGKSSSKIGVDKVGLTQFYRQPILDVTQWPGEVDHPYVAPQNRKASKEVNYGSIEKDQKMKGNTLFSEIDEKIARIEEEIGKIIKGIYPQYKWPHKLNPKNLQLMAENRARKNPETAKLQAKIKELENQKRDWCLINNKNYREGFIRVYGGLPPNIRNAEFTDLAKVDEKDKNKKAAKKSQKRKKPKGTQTSAKAPKLKAIAVSNFTLTKNTITFNNALKEISLKISKDAKFLDFDGNPTTLAKLMNSQTVQIKKTEDDRELVVEIQDATITARVKKGKHSAKSDNTDPDKKAAKKSKKSKKKKKSGEDS